MADQPGTDLQRTLDRMERCLKRIERNIRETNLSLTRMHRRMVKLERRTKNLEDLRRRPDRRTGVLNAKGVSTTLTGGCPLLLLGSSDPQV